MRTRAYRRVQYLKSKKKAEKIASRYWEKGSYTERDVGRLASTHGVMCSCDMCGNPRRHHNERTIQEKREMQEPLNGENNYE